MIKKVLTCLIYILLGLVIISTILAFKVENIIPSQYAMAYTYFGAFFYFTLIGLIKIYFIKYVK